MSAVAVTRETRLRRRSDVLIAGVGAEESVMMSVSEGGYYGLNAIASAIWHALDTPKSVAELCALLEEAFEIDPKTCEADVIKFAGDLIGFGVVEIAP